MVFTESYKPGFLGENSGFLLAMQQEPSRFFSYPYQWMAPDQETEPVDDETDMEGFGQIVWFTCQITFTNSLFEAHCQPFDTNRLAVLTHETVHAQVVHRLDVDAFPPADGIHRQSLNPIRRQPGRTPGLEQVQVQVCPMPFKVAGQEKAFAFWHRGKSLCAIAVRTSSIETAVVFPF